MKIVLYAEVVFDGIGDYVHLEDIYNYLQARGPYKDAEFVIILDLFGIPDKAPGMFSNTSALLATPHPHCEKIVKRLESLKARNHSKCTYFLNIEPVAIEAHLKDADFIASISSAENGGLGAKCPEYLSNIIQIIEHEVGGVYSGLMGIGFDRKRQVYGMGLADDQCGIKIADVPRITAKKAWSIVEQQSPKLARKLLEETDSDGVLALAEKHYIMPAYFNYNIDFLRFLRLVTAHATLADKNFVIIHSGTNLVDTFINGQERLGAYRINFEEHVVKEFVGTSVRKIQIIRPDSVALLFDNNKETGPIVSIFNGFEANNEAYDALYQLATLAGVSGDNSFEKTVATGVFPYYKSTNFETYKLATIHGLKAITQLNEMPISEAARKSFNGYFDYKLIGKFTRGNEQERTEALQEFSKLNFPEMIAAWPIIVSFLKLNRNFCDYLPAIFSTSMGASNGIQFFTNPHLKPMPNSERTNIFPVIQEANHAPPAP